MKYLEHVRAQYAAKMAERDAHLAALGELAEAVEARDNTFTDDEKATVDEHEAAVRALAPELDALTTRIAELEVEAERAAISAKAPTFIRKPDAPTPVDVRAMPRGEVRDAALRVIDEERDVDITDANRERVAKLVRAGRTTNFDGDLVARRLLLTENEHYRSAWQKAATSTVPAFTPEEARALSAYDEFRAMSLTDAAGGYGVPVLIDPSIIITSGAADAPLLRVSRIEMITNDEWKGVSSAGAGWAFAAEATAVTDNSPTLAQPNVVAHFAHSFIPFSIPIGGDYPGFASEMSKLLEQGYLDLLATKTATGSGTNEPFGIITALDANTNVEVVVTTDGAFGAIDVDKAWKSLPERYRERSTWVMNVDVENEIRAFGSGTATSRFTVDQTAFGINKLNGRPVIITDYFPEFTGTTGASNILVVGDFQNYLVAQRVGMSVELVPHVFDVTNNRPTGQRGWYAWARVGADSVNDNGFRLLQNQ